MSDGFIAACTLLISFDVIESFSCRDWHFAVVTFGAGHIISPPLPMCDFFLLGPLDIRGKHAAPEPAGDVLHRLKRAKMSRMRYQIQGNQ